MESETCSDLSKVTEMNHNHEKVQETPATDDDCQTSSDTRNKTTETVSDTNTCDKVEKLEMKTARETGNNVTDESAIADQSVEKKENDKSLSDNTLGNSVANPVETTDDIVEPALPILEDNEITCTQDSVVKTEDIQGSNIQNVEEIGTSKNVDITDSSNDIHNASGGVPGSGDLLNKDINTVENNMSSQESSVDATSKVESDTLSGEAACPSGSALSPKSKSMQSIYFLKQVKFNGEHLQIVTQNENGPCPLLGIANVLALSKRICLPSMQECITASQLMEYIGDYILNVAPKNADEHILLNYQQNMHDAISIMHKLQTGIDVNVKFTGPRDFEFTSECLVFDLLNIGLYHGWLVDPQDISAATAVGSLSYNQLVEKIIKSTESSATEEMASEGLLAEDFLQGTASQLTYHGLCELNSVIREEELCVFFRNNHFSTLYKRKGELFLLVTDQGYLNQSRIIWETLANVDGAGQFVDENFHTVGPLSYPSSSTEPKPKPTVPEDQLTQEDKDYLIALSLQEDAQAQRAAKSPNDTANQVPSVSMGIISPAQQEANDLALAQRLQNEEEEYARRQQLQQSQYAQQPRQQQTQMPYHQQHQPTRSEVVGRGEADSRNTEKCTIL